MSEPAKQFFDLDRIKCYMTDYKRLYDIIYRVDVEFVSPLKLSLHSPDDELL
jgi:hypothetical protein